ncbi:YihY/virulence factor BrkB family protein [Epilithonimonas sp. JDS]|uniref:YihY/virulence factor BrkB family protein n=1 Tax=Epilithonimonas sp. JDS TaxID=2902797 RepID=UPI001E2B2EE8|nr:YihY/virulence factor BrkB family protein [Epilithonimonas sp. JDS]MCD9856589.1 YihY/virulence factor BrkB family protein [Epilithonimonas sp. JDS]
MTKLKSFWEILKETFNEWTSSSASKDSASMAYNAIFALPGLMIIIIWSAGHFFGEEAVNGEIRRQIQGVIGYDGAKSIQDIIASAMIDKENFWMKALGVATLVFGATSLFFQMQTSLNNLWDVEAAPKKAWQKFILDRANSLGMILIITFLLLISMVLSSVIGLANGLITKYFGLEAYVLIQGSNFILGFAVITVLFAIMFKVLPDVEIKWKSVWIGAIVTALLFNVGKMLMSFYFDMSKPTSVFGAAGTVILLMMWINYSCQLIFFGAEFTKVYAVRKGHKIIPSKHAKWSKAKLYRDSEEEKGRIVPKEL